MQPQSDVHMSHVKRVAQLFEQRNDIITPTNNNLTSSTSGDSNHRRISSKSSVSEKYLSLGRKPTMIGTRSTPQASPLSDGQLSAKSIHVQKFHHTDPADVLGSSIQPGEDKSNRVTVRSTASLPSCKLCRKSIINEDILRADDKSTYHVDCFRCCDCNEKLSDIYYLHDGLPICENDQYRRMKLLCFKCGCPLKGEYIQASGKLFHLDHFTCTLCPLVFQANDIYYEQGGLVYCHFHFSKHVAKSCCGCGMAIIKKFVQLPPSDTGAGGPWHPECYLMYKTFGIKMRVGSHYLISRFQDISDPIQMLVAQQEWMDARVKSLWSLVSSFEELSASCISSILLDVANENFQDALNATSQFLICIDSLEQAMEIVKNAISHRDTSEAENEMKTLFSQTLNLLELLEMDFKGEPLMVVGKKGTREMIALVTCIAQSLKTCVHHYVTNVVIADNDNWDSQVLDESLQILDSVFEIAQTEAYECFLEQNSNNSILANKLKDLSSAIRVREQIANRQLVEDSFDPDWLRKESSENDQTAIPNSSQVFTLERIDEFVLSKDSYLKFLSGKRPETLIINDLDALELFMVKHLSVVHLAQMVEPYISMNELLSLVGSRKTSFWSKVVSTLNGIKPKKQEKEDGTFGMSLFVLSERYGTVTDLGYGPKRITVPAIFDCILNNLLECDLRVEGIFRRNGQVRAINELVEKLDTSPNDIMDIVGGEKNPIHLASLLKRFLRELPEPLLTQRLFKLFLISQKMPREQDQILVLYFACILLPEVNRNVLEVLLLFLRYVASFQGQGGGEGVDGNRMDLTNLATIIAPNIMSQPLKAGENPGQSYDQIIAVVKCLLVHQETIWSIPAEIQRLFHQDQISDITAAASSKDLLHNFEQLNRKMSEKHQSLEATSN